MHIVYFCNIKIHGTSVRKISFIKGCVVFWNYNLSFKLKSKCNPTAFNSNDPKLCRSTDMPLTKVSILQCTRHVFAAEPASKTNSFNSKGSCVLWLGCNCRCCVWIFVLTFFSRPAAAKTATIVPSTQVQPSPTRVATLIEKEGRWHRKPNISS